MLVKVVYFEVSDFCAQSSHFYLNVGFNAAKDLLEILESPNILKLSPCPINCPFKLINNNNSVRIFLCKSDEQAVVNGQQDSEDLSFGSVWKAQKSIYL